MSPSRPTRTGPAILACLLVACADDQGAAPSRNAITFTERDSAGILIVESSAEALDTTLPWTVDTVPSLELGQIDGDAETQFHDVGGILGLPDGGLIVVDAGSRELRRFDAAGEHLWTAGGPGQGPGEFEAPVLVSQFEADSLLIFDRRRRAFTWVAVDGSGARALGPGGPAFVGTPSVATGSTALFRTSGSGRGSCPDNVGCERPLLLRRVDVIGTPLDTLTRYPHREMTFTESGPRVRLTSPFHQTGLAAPAPGGLVVEGDPGFELRQFDAQGRLARVFRVSAPPRMTPEVALDLYVQRSPNPDDFRHIFELMGLPEVVPAFQTLLVDPLGWSWAELFQPEDGGGSEWLVFDPDGRARGVMELPRELEVHEIGEDFILGLRVDELGVEYVRRHALERSRN